MMLLKALKTLVVTALTAVAVPYAVALTANILYGWPLGPNRYHRALHPTKVLHLNYALLLQLRKLRFLLLSLRWRQFYLGASKDELIRVSDRHKYVSHMSKIGTTTSHSLCQLC